MSSAIAHRRTDQKVMTVQTPLSQHHVTLFQKLLESTSVHTLLPMLDARSRWLLIVEILLGNAPVRGGRSRDYPFSVDRADSTRIAFQLVCCKRSFRPGSSAVSGDYSIYDLIVALQCIEACEVSDQMKPAKSEQHFTIAIRVLVEMLFPKESRKVVLATVGVSDKGEDGAVKKSRSYLRGEIEMAKRLAVLARAQVPPSDASEPVGFLRRHFGLSDKDVAELERPRLTLIYLKTKEAQSFIDRCLSPFIQRGASFWCSQTSARVRDLLTSSASVERGILLDNDAITILSGSSCEKVEDLEATIRKMCFEPNDHRQVSSAFIARNYPRLMPYYRAAKEGGMSTAMAMPAFGVQVRAKSLLDMATDFTAPDSLTGSIPEEDSVVIGSREPANEVAELPCSGRKEDMRIRSEKLSVPSWYDRRIGEGYGFPSIAFSLAELTYAKASGRAIALQLKERGCADLTTASTQKELLAGTHSPDDRLAYLKYDGDSFGTKFSEIPSLRRPSLSITLEMLMRESWLSAVASLAKEHKFNVVPADLVYFGGDDILITLPAYLLHEFLHKFDEALGENTESSRDVSFTFSAVTFSLPIINHSEKNQDVNLHTETIGEVNQLLRNAKILHKSSVQSDGHMKHHYLGRLCQWTSLSRSQGFIVDTPSST